MNLNELQKSVSEMSEEELTALFRTIRMARRSAPKTLAKEARGEVATPVKKAKSLIELVAGLTDEEKAAFFAQITKP